MMALNSFKRIVSCQEIGEIYKIGLLIMNDSFIYKYLKKLTNYH